MPTPALQPGRICTEAVVTLFPHPHPTNGSWPTGYQAEQKEGDSFYDSFILGRGPDLLYLILASWAGRERACLPRLGRVCVWALPLQLPEQELNAQYVCQSLLTSFFFLRAMQKEAAEECHSTRLPNTRLPPPVAYVPPIPKAGVTSEKCRGRKKSPNVS